VVPTDQLRAGLRSTFERLAGARAKPSVVDRAVIPCIMSVRSEAGVEGTGIGVNPRREGGAEGVGIERGVGLSEPPPLVADFARAVGGKGVCSHPYSKPGNGTFAQVFF